MVSVAVKDLPLTSHSQNIKTEHTIGFRRPRVAEAPNQVGGFAEASRVAMEITDIY